MEYVQTDAQLGAIAEQLRDARLVAADTEAAGYHRYRDRVCVLQLSTRTDDYVVDALAVEDLEPLRAVFADPDTEIIFHDASFDLRLLSRDFDLPVHGLFDTKIAAQFLGERAPGLANLLEKYVGVKLAKKHQLADWARRPLPQEWIEYAVKDTHYLPALRDRLRAALEARGRLAWAEEEFRVQEGVRWEEDEDDPEAFLQLKKTRDLNPRQLAALRELYAWREAEARERDRAPFRIVANHLLVNIARELPRSPKALATVPGMPRSTPRRYGDALLGAVRRALALPNNELPVRPSPPPRPARDPEFEQALAELRAERTRVAEELELDPGFLMPRSQLEVLARRRPRSREELEAVPDVRHWQIEALGDNLLSVLRAL